MTTTAIKLSRPEAAPILKASGLPYNGRNIKLEVRPTYSIQAHQLCWDDGTKHEVAAVLNVDGRLVSRELGAVAPWSGESYSGEIPKNGAIVEIGYFQSKAVVCYIRVCPGSDLLPKLLPAEQQAAA